MSEISVNVNNKSNTRSRVKEIWGKITGFRETTVIITIIAISFILSLLTPHFLTKVNLSTTALGMAADGIIAVGMTIILITAGVDLSVGSVLGIAGVMAGGLYLNYGMNIWLASIIAMLVSLLCGVINGYFIGKVGLNPLITTLGMMGIARGGAYVMTQGSPLSMSGVPKSFTSIGGGNVLGIPTFVIIFIVIVVVCDYLLRRSPSLRKVFYTGSNEKAAILSGINTANVKMYVYVFCAFLSGLAGVLSLSRFNVATPNAGVGTDMRVISACVIGGASLSGGEGTVLGSVLGVILLNVINNGLILLNVSVYWQDLISGVILIGAVTIDYTSHQKKARKLISK